VSASTESAHRSHLVDITDGDLVDSSQGIKTREKLKLSMRTGVSVSRLPTLTLAEPYAGLEVRTRVDDSKHVSHRCAPNDCRDIDG
jgi:hypothetical protein